MIEELLQHKFLLVGVVLLIIAMIYRLFLNKNKTGELVEREYDEIISSDKYKVKSR